MGEVVKASEPERNW